MYVIDSWMNSSVTGSMHIFDPVSWSGRLYDRMENFWILTHRPRTLQKSKVNGAKSNPYIDLRSFDAYHLTLVFVLGAIPTSIEESIHLNVRGFVGTGTKGTRLRKHKPGSSGQFN